MKAFLWQGIDQVCEEYHQNGSVLIEAESLERARSIAVFEETGWGLNPMIGVEREPDAIFESSSSTEKVWIFQHTGCCR